MADRPVKDWQDSPSSATPLDAAGQEDQETRAFDYTEAVVAEHSADTTNVHGIVDTTVLATDAELVAHAADTDNVHGIADTSLLALQSDSRFPAGADIVDADIGASAAIAQSKIASLTSDLAGKQPLDSDLTAIAALTTTSFGRAFLELADAAAARTAISAQPVDSDLTAIAALTTTSYGRALLELADAAAARTAISAQASDATLTALAGLATGADKLPYSTGTDTFSQADLTAAARALLDDADAAAMRTTLGVPAVAVENGQPGLVAPTARGYVKINNAFTANRCGLSRFVPSRNLAVTKMAYLVATAGGSGDQVRVGIYSGDLGTLLGSSAATTPGHNTTGLKLISLSSTVNLTAGAVYYAALVGDTSAGTWHGAWFDAGGDIFFGTAIGTFETGFKDVGSFTLTSSITSPTAAGSGLGPMMAVRES